MSKSRVMAGWQCAKQLWLRVNRPDLKTERIELFQFVHGSEVQKAARALIPDGVIISRDQGLYEAAKTTEMLWRQRKRLTLFEATFTHNELLVQADILRRGARGAELVEVKAATEVKDYYLMDCAIQAHVIESAGVPLKQIKLAHVNNQFLYETPGDYRGLINEVDVTGQVRPLALEVPRLVRSLRRALQKDEPDIEPGPQCTDPFECPFIAYCCRDSPPYPVSTLPRGARVAEELAAEGILSIEDIPEGRLNNGLHEKIRRCIANDAEEIDPAITGHVRGLRYPRYYLDFEAIQFAVPRWLGTRPYEQLPFQWSCHIERADGSLEHRDFLDLSGDPPMRAFAESLIAKLGRRGPIIVYSAFEKTMINNLIARFPDLKVELSALIARLEDLLPWVRKCYYHPSMHGSFSIKAVLPAIAPEFTYDDLPGIHDGMQAQYAYWRVVTGENDPVEVDASLRAYCERDTLALYCLAKHFSK